MSRGVVQVSPLPCGICIEQGIIMTVSNASQSSLSSDINLQINKCITKWLVVTNRKDAVLHVGSSLLFNCSSNSWIVFSPSLFILKKNVVQTFNRKVCILVTLPLITWIMSDFFFWGDTFHVWDKMVCVIVKNDFTFFTTIPLNSMQNSLSN